MINQEVNDDKQKNFRYNAVAGCVLHLIDSKMAESGDIESVGL